jgi:hypothetical protein
MRGDRTVRRLIARQSRIRAALERLQAEAEATDGGEHEERRRDGIRHAVSIIMAALEEVEE